MQTSIRDCSRSRLRLSDAACCAKPQAAFGRARVAKEVTMNPEPPFVTTLSHAAADPFRLLVEAVKDYGIFMLDPAGNVSSWNPGAEKSKGYKAEEIIGQHVSCFYTAEDVAAGKP